jgi:shikimate kinase
MSIKPVPNIFLTGFMGSGKTTIGRMAARSIGFTFYDIDEIIETQTGKIIQDIFRQDGEPFFRLLEKQILNDIIKRNNVVVSLGGGTLMNPANIPLVKQHGILIYLSVEPVEIWERVKDTNKRPLLQKSDGTLVSDAEALQHIENLLTIRLPGYSFADIIVPTDNKSEEEVLGIILKNIVM